MKQNKRENFERLAEKRMTEAIKKIRLIGNLSNRNNYDYTDAHVKEMISTLENEIVLLKNKFKQDEERETTFTFTKNK